MKSKNLYNKIIIGFGLVIALGTGYHIYQMDKNNINYNGKKINRVVLPISAILFGAAALKEEADFRKQLKDPEFDEFYENYKQNKLEKDLTN